MHRTRIPILSGTLVLVAFCLAALRSAPAQENLLFQLGAEWEPRPANVQEVPNQYLIMEFVKKGEKIDTWSDLVTIQNFNKRWGGRSTRQAYEGLREIRERRCPGATTWEVISEDKTSILYAAAATGCADQPDQRELVRILFGRNNRYRVSYATKGELTPQARDTWVAWLAGLKLSR